MRKGSYLCGLALIVEQHLWKELEEGDEHLDGREQVEPCEVRDGLYIRSVHRQHTQTEDLDAHEETADSDGDFGGPLCGGEKSVHRSHDHGHGHHSHHSHILVYIYIYIYTQAVLTILIRQIYLPDTACTLVEGRATSLLHTCFHPS